MATTEKGTIQVDGYEITITNPLKPIWPELGITKLQYLQTLIELSPFLLRHCNDRYLTTIRYPHGIHGSSFYQKNVPQPKPEFVTTAVYDQIEYVVLDSLPTLIWLANLACLEFHISFETIHSPYPAQWVIDLDPTIDPEPRIMEAAYIIGEILRSLGIQSVPKTSGATGVQLIVPIERKYTFTQLRKLGYFIAQYCVAKYPNLFTIERMKKDRGNLIYIDYLQFWPGKTIAAPYTPRAKVSASVSTPLTWEEVKGGVDISLLNLLNITSRIKEKGDLLDLITSQNLEHILSQL